MLIRRTIAKDGNLAPSGWNALAAIPDNFSFHADHGKRHPKSAYGTSLRAIADQWLKALDRLDQLHSEHNWKGTETCFPDILDEYRELLYRLNEHFDACCSALRSLCPASAAKPVTFDSQFLTQAKLAGWKQFRDATKSYREDHIGLLVNTLKHRQGELCPIHFHSVVEFRPGYYLRDVLPGGALGPSEKLHSSGETAFSFSRDMLLHLWWLYQTGDLLSTAVATALRVQHTHELSVARQDFPEEKWSEVVRRCAAIKPEFFPDETSKPYPRILYQVVPCALTLEFPTTARGHRLGAMQVSTAFTVDGAHLSNKLPYMASKT
jgi:hypothetical protein